jgi:hypothetical protein
MNRYNYEKKEYSIAQMAYLAGIIDGEGSIYIGNFSSNPKTGSKYYQTNIEVTNSDKPLMDWIVETFGGRLHKYTAKQTPKNSRRSYWRWIATGERVTHLTQILLPYLITKKPQAEIMIKMRETYKPKNGVIRGVQGIAVLDKELLDLRQSYFDQIRALHCRNYNNPKT